MALSPEAPGQDFAVQVVRFSSLHWIGIVISMGLSFASTMVIIRFLDPSEYGQLALLLFLAATISIVFTILARGGTLRRVFGGGAEEDDDVDDEEDVRVVSAQPPHTMGNGFILTVLGGLVGVAIVVPLAGPITDFLVGEDGDSSIAGWAAATGIAMAVQELGLTCVWLERRPVVHLFLMVAQPIVYMGTAIPLVAGGAGVLGAILGAGIANAAAACLALVALRKSFVLRPDPREWLLIMRAGVHRIPIVSSMYVIHGTPTFMVSRYASNAEVGIFHLAMRFAAMLVFVAGSYRASLRPLMRSLDFRAAREAHGRPTARGEVLGYFMVLATGSVLLATLFAEPLAGLVPDTYSGISSLIPLITAALLAPLLYRTVIKCVSISHKLRWYILLLIAAALSFVAFSVLLVPWLGVKGVPAAMMAAFVGPILSLLVRSQRGPKPIAIPYARIGLGLVAAAACGYANHMLAPDGLLATLLACAFVAAFGVFVLYVYMPAEHRHSIVAVVRGAVGRARGRFDPVRGVSELPAEDRAMLKLAIAADQPLDRVAAAFGYSERRAGGRLVRGLRRAAHLGGGSQSDRSSIDAQVAEYLFWRADIASRDKFGKRLLRAGQIGPGELSALEAVLARLRTVPPELWSGGGNMPGSVAAKNPKAGRGNGGPDAPAAGSDGPERGDDRLSRIGGRLSGEIGEPREESRPEDKAGRGGVGDSSSAGAGGEAAAAPTMSKQQRRRARKATARAERRAKATPDPAATAAPEPTGGAAAHAEVSEGGAQLLRTHAELLELQEEAAKRGERDREEMRRYRDEIDERIAATAAGQFKDEIDRLRAALEEHQKKSDRRAEQQTEKSVTREAERISAEISRRLGQEGERVRAEAAEAAAANSERVVDQVRTEADELKRQLDQLLSQGQTVLHALVAENARRQQAELTRGGGDGPTPEAQRVIEAEPVESEVEHQASSEVEPQAFERPTPVGRRRTPFFVQLAARWKRRRDD